MSAQQLADKCSEIGFPIARSVLANFENGRRLNVSLAEVIVLGSALGVPPVALFYPVGLVEEVEFVPGVNGAPLSAVAWFSGEAPAQKRDLRPNQSDLMRSEIFMVRKVAEGKRQLLKKQHRILQLRHLARDAPTDDLKRAYEQSAREEQRLLDQGEEQVRWWIEFLATDHSDDPEASYLPLIPFPDADPPGGAIDIEMVAERPDLPRMNFVPGIPRD
jgi:transcriptional regulator with XRE-family HTH domain